MTFRYGGVLHGTASSATASSSGGGGGGVVFSGTFEDSDQALDNIQTAYTFSGMTFGTAAAARIIIVAVGYAATAVASTATVTIGGITATQIKRVERLTPDGETIGLALYQAAVPSGTSGSVVVTFSAAQRGCAVALWQVVTGTQAAQNSGSSSVASGSTSIAATVPASGYAVCATLIDDTTVLGTSTPSNYTEDFDGVDIWTNGHVYIGGGHFTATATIGAAPSGTSEGSLMVYASWGP